MPTVIGFSAVNDKRSATGGDEGVVIRYWLRVDAANILSRTLSVYAQVRYTLSNDGFGTCLLLACPMAATFSLDE
jgi:hypothetical protein